MKDKVSKVTVAVRVKPELERPNIITVEDDRLTLLNPSNVKKDALKIPRYLTENCYTFDHVFNYKASNFKVFKHTVPQVLKQLLGGVNTTVFAYGQTGSGKTHTMLGPSYNPEIGIVQQTVQLLFAQPNLGEVTMSFFQIYNEHIQDLLLKSNTQTLEVCEDPRRGTVVSNLAQVRVTGRAEVTELIKVGTQHRTTGVTDQNKVSSRSHAVLQFYVTVEGRIVKLTMIDLAGSERIHSLNIKQPKQIIEGSCINKSLLALGNCIAGLVKL